MPSITLKDIPAHLHETYKRRAKAHRRSLQAEILSTLATHASLPADDSTVSIAEVAGMLRPERKGVSVQDMDKAVEELARKSWKPSR